MLLTTNLEHRVLNNGNSEETFTSALLVVSNQQHFPIDLLYPLSKQLIQNMFVSQILPFFTLVT